MNTSVWSKLTLVSLEGYIYALTPILTFFFKQYIFTYVHILENKCLD